MCTGYSDVSWQLGRVYETMCLMTRSEKVFVVREEHVGVDHISFICDNSI